MKVHNLYTRVQYTEVIILQNVKTSQKYLLQILQICNRIFPNLFAIAICNKQNLIALQFICNKPVIYWTRSGNICDDMYYFTKESHIMNRK